MIQLPPKVSRGDQITASWANKVVEAIAALRPMAGAGTRISQNPGGFIISANTSAGSIITQNPWDIIPFTDSTGNTNIKIWPGNVNGFMPENMSDYHTVDDSSTYLIKCRILSDGNSIVRVTLNVSTDQPQPQVAVPDAMPSNFDIVVGMYDKGVASNFVKKNITTTPSSVFGNGYWAIS
jgi:hypothetical protein